MLSGAITALVTPFRDGEVDLAALEKLVGWQIGNGVDGLLACGCTGEAATLTDEEREDVVSTVMSAAGGRVPVMAGTGTNSTATTVELTRRISRMGVDAVLLITPYYNKPTHRGQVEHFTRAADASQCPAYLYNVPGRTGKAIAAKTVAELARHPNIAGIKDAQGSVERVTELRSLCGEGFDILSGDDPLAMAQAALGAEGVVSVISNIAPGEMSRMVKLARSGDLEEARGLQARLLPAIRAMFLQTNPMPVKKALWMKGMVADELRLPLVPMRKDLEGRLREVLEEAGLL
jgi:4-hydroxy-tetrahydrodipicolinate synthase